MSADKLNEFFKKISKSRTLIKTDSPAFQYVLTAGHIIQVFGKENTILVFMTKKDERALRLVGNQLGVENDYTSYQIDMGKDWIRSKEVVQKLKEIISENEDKTIVILGLPSYAYKFNREGLIGYSSMLDEIPDDVTLINFCLENFLDQTTLKYQKYLFDVVVSIRRLDHPDRYIFIVENTIIQDLTDKVGYIITEGFQIKEFNFVAPEDLL